MNIHGAPEPFFHFFLFFFFLQCAFRDVFFRLADHRHRSREKFKVGRERTRLHNARIVIFEISLFTSIIRRRGRKKDKSKLVLSEKSGCDSNGRWEKFPLPQPSRSYYFIKVVITSDIYFLPFNAAGILFFSIVRMLFIFLKSIENF